eukprot:CAMPEP_0202689784 /NCGR_PEP_ID=MMETSP1385-20130828/4967_1 /ASSEMBLY_ACC=CAM_ASM_000861 /TAXON_ID=933848 /ORGANISM="Elphidium margaritaceum" /LENGTH=706 /DNA_ID=CAMNT_0049344971 /DNA_START=42 /DNA_END=2162 /DNA_ORIENTATION=+
MGCCLQQAQMPDDSASDMAKCLDDPDMKHLNIMQQLSNNVTNSSRDEFTADKSVETAKKSSTYNLTDLRSLEGVARLWSKAAPSRPLPFLQCSKSTPMTGNVYTPPVTDASPPSISTYFFQHARPTKLKFMQSHSNRITNFMSAVPRSQMKICPENAMVNHHLLDDDAIAVAHAAANECIDRSTPHSKSMSNLRIHDPAASASASAVAGKVGVCSLSRKLDRNIMTATTSSGSDCDEREFDPFDIAIDLGPMTMEIELDLPETMSMRVETVGLDFGVPCEPIAIANVDVASTSMTATTNDCSVNADMIALDALCEQYPESVLHVEDFVAYPQAVNIGVGASSVVTKAFHLRSCKMMAIKTCRVQQNDKVRSFQHEIELHHQLLHNVHLIDMVGFGKNETSNEMFVALEFMDLNSAASLKLHDTIDSMAQRELIVGHIAWNVLCALCAVHELGYVHNDIKPANILVNSYAEVKLSDFDTMLALSGPDDLLHKNNGTQKYQSPEKTIFEVAYNTRTDIWSLGVSCYEMLFGDATCSDEELSYVLSPPRLDPSTHNLSPACCAFINACLTVDAQHRPSATQLLQHAWFTQHIQTVALKQKWPYLSKLDNSAASESYYHEDLLFMINALIQYYGSRQFDTNLQSESVPVLRDDINNKSGGAGNNAQYTDEARVTNMAKYAFCSKRAVMERINVMVVYIKAHLNKMENTRT